MTKLGWPVAQPRFTSRPSASTMTWWPSGNLQTSVPGFSSSRVAPERASPAMSISLSKWPMLQTMALCFIRAMCSVGDDVGVAGGRHEHVDGADDVVERRDLVALHRRLQGVDRVDLGDDDPAALAAQALGAALADVAVAGHDGDLAAEHHVGRPAQGVDERVAAAVEVVELRLRDRVVDVDRREQQLTVGVHLVQPLDAGRRLLGDALDGGRHARPLRRVGAQRALQQPEDERQLGVRRAGRVGHLAGLLVLDALVQQQRGVAAVVEDHVRLAAVGPRHHLLGAPPVLLERLALPGVDRDALRILGRAVRADDDRRGAWSWVEKMLQLAQRTSAPSSTSVSMRTAVWIVMCSDPEMRAPASGLTGAELGAQRPQAGHLVLGEQDLLAAERGERQVGDAEVAARVASVDVMGGLLDRLELGRRAGACWHRSGQPVAARDATGHGADVPAGAISRTGVERRARCLRCRCGTAGGRPRPRRRRGPRRSASSGCRRGSSYTALQARVVEHALAPSAR